jgi:hypothetical protein
VPRDDGRGDFRELLLLERTPRRWLLLAGVLGLLPPAVVAALAAAFLVPSRPLLSGATTLGYGLLAGAVVALAYRRGQIPYRRGDLTALIACTLLIAPLLVLTARAVGQDVALGILLIFSLLPALIVELCWRVLFLLTLRRLSGLHLDTLVHESLREHYGDDWEAYRRKISADLREARRLRDQAEGGKRANDSRR